MEHPGCPIAHPNRYGSMDTSGGAVQQLIKLDDGRLASGNKAATIAVRNNAECILQFNNTDSVPLSRLMQVMDGRIVGINICV